MQRLSFVPLRKRHEARTDHPRQPAQAQGSADGQEDAAALIKDGDVVIVGGFGTVNHPMPIIRALIRRKVKNLTIIGAATAGLEIDMLIGAGCVKKVIAPYVGAELHAPVGNCFRYAAENDEIEVYETTEYLLYSQLDAAARGLGFMPWRGGVGTSLPVLNPTTFRSTIRSTANLISPCPRFMPTGPSSMSATPIFMATASMAARASAIVCCRARPNASC